MLLRFEASNHRSIEDPVELSMIAVDKGRPATRVFELLSEEVMTVAGIYGPNASGKSNLIDALAWLSAAVGRSLRVWDEFVPREPFRFRAGLLEPSSFEIEMMVEEVRYTYRLEVSDEAVLYEALHSYPLRKRRLLFEREGGDLHFRRGLGSQAGTRELLTQTTLALSASMRLADPEIRAFGRAVSNITSLGPRKRGRMRPRLPHPLARTARLFDDEYGFRQSDLFTDPELSHSDERGSALALLRFADLGIDDVVVTEETNSDDTDRPSRRTLQLLHRAAGQALPFDMEDESDGTRTWFDLIGPVLRALRTGQVLLFDEIDASLHPSLSARLLEMFQDPATNPFGAQLIFTSHDASLLGHLNRDEVWLTEKGSNGATTLTALAEYGGGKVRRSVNLERAYLQGRFGAVPELDQYLLRQAVGLLDQD